MKIRRTAATLFLATAIVGGSAGAVGAAEHPRTTEVSGGDLGSGRVTGNISGTDLGSGRLTSKISGSSLGSGRVTTDVSGMDLGSGR